MTRRFSLLLLPLLVLALYPVGAAAQQAVARFPATTQPAFAPAPAAVDAGSGQLVRQEDGFETTGFAQFMASPAGRILRGGAGLAMIGGGIALGDTGGTALAIAGGIPLSAAVFDLCYISALMGGPIRGEDIRAAGR